MHSLYVVFVVFNIQGKKLLSFFIGGIFMEYHLATIPLRKVQRRIIFIEDHIPIEFVLSAPMLRF